MTRFTDLVGIEHPIQLAPMSRAVTPELAAAVSNLGGLGMLAMGRSDADVCLVPMEHSVLDSQHSHAVIARMLRAQRATVLKAEYTSGQILSLMSKFNFVVGMRLHFLIFAALRGVPFAALPYAGKVSGFLDELGVPSPPMNLVNAGRLIAYIDHSWDHARTMRSQLAKNVAPLQKRAQETHRILVELLTREKLQLASVKAA